MKNSIILVLKQEKSLYSRNLKGSRYNDADPNSKIEEMLLCVFSMAN